MDDPKKILGSETAKEGFRNEDDVINRLNNWKNSPNAKKWLEVMGYNPKEIEKVKAVKITGGHKTDVQVQVTIFMKEAIAAENLSIKLVSNPQGFNQIDKRKIQKYVEMWNIPADVTRLLKLFTGETKPEVKGLKDPRRIFLNEMPEEDQNKVVDFFKRNQILIVSDILKGRGKFAADWMLVILKANGYKWTLQEINKVMNFFGEGDVYATDRGSLRIGKITVQRKGGDAGRDSAKMLQFKINPAALFELEDG